MQFRWARYWVSVYWQYTGPGSTSLVAEGGARIPGYWQLTYVPKHALQYKGNPSKRAHEKRGNSTMLYGKYVSKH